MCMRAGLCVYVWSGCMREYVFVHMCVCVSGGVHKYYCLIAVYNPTYMLIAKALCLLRSVRIRHKTQSL